jgi:hypothetical protein
MEKDVGGMDMTQVELLCPVVNLEGLRTPLKSQTLFEPSPPEYKS